MICFDIWLYIYVKVKCGLIVGFVLRWLGKLVVYDEFKCVYIIFNECFFLYYILNGKKFIC